jgi:HEAT repeat protein
MNRLVLFLSLTQIILIGSRSATAGETPNEVALKEAGVGISDKDLVAFLKEKSESDGDLKNIYGLVAQLGSEHYADRESARKKLISIGLPALPELRQGAKSKDAEIARGCLACLQEVERDQTWECQRLAVRLLILRKPPDAIETLVRFLPFAGDPKTEEEICYGVNQLIEAGLSKTPLVAALENAVGCRRALACCILGRIGNDRERARVKQLLTDSNAEVRLRAAQGFLAGGREDGITTLIALLRDAPVHLAWQAEELLRWVAGGKAPTELIGTGEDSRRRKCAAAWDNWWLKERGNINTGEDRARRPTLVLAYSNETGGTDGKRKAELSLVGSDGTRRWENKTLLDPCSVHFLPNGEGVVIAEGFEGVTVREISLQNETKRKMDLEALGAPSACERLPNGHTFVAIQNRVWEFSSEGKILIAKKLTSDDYLNLCIVERLPRGRVVCSSLEGPILESNIENGEETFRITPSETKGTGTTAFLSTASNGDFLFFDTRLGTIIVSDRAGKCSRVHKERRLYGVSSGLHGTMFLAYGASGDSGRIAEIDQSGEVLSEIFLKDTALGPGSRVHPCFEIVRLGFLHRLGRGHSLGDVQHEVALLNGKDEQARRSAAMVLQTIESKVPASVVPGLFASLEDNDEVVRSNVLEVLLRSVNKDSAGHIIKSLKSKNKHARVAGLFLAARLGDSDPELIDYLLDALKEPSPLVRANAATAISTLKTNKVAVPKLVIALGDRERETDQDQRVCVAAAWALSSSTTLREAKPLPVKIGAAESLGRLGAPAKSAIPVLCEMFFLESSEQEQIEHLRCVATWSIGRMGREGRPAVPSLVKLINNRKESQRTRRSGIQALADIGPPAIEAVPFLQKLLGDDADRSLHDAARDALANIRPIDKP